MTSVCDNCGHSLPNDAYKCPHCRRYQAHALIRRLGHEDPAIRRQAANDLVHVDAGTEVVAKLAAALSDVDPEVRLCAGTTLFTFGKDAQSATCALIAGLDHHDVVVRRLATACLSNVGLEAREALPKLLEMQDVPDAKLRAWVAEALRTISS